MTKDEALKMAIEAFELYADANSPIRNKAIQACKEALALSEKQHTFPDKKQPTQEPVAWMNDIAFSMDKELLGTRSRIVPLYTHPAPAWQGLTAKEIASITLNEYTVQTVERILKEKNT